MKTQVVIVGAGIGGLSLATMLIDAGVDVLVLEQARRLDVVGAGIQLSPNGVRVLDRVGARGSVQAAGTRAAAIEFRSWREDRLLGAVPHGERCVELYGAPYVVIHRADLQVALRTTVSPDRVRLGKRVTDVRQRADQVELTTSDGDRFEADVVVGCDGVHSVVRTQVVEDAPRYTGYGVFRTLVPAECSPARVQDSRVRFWLGPEGHITCYPVTAGDRVHVSAVVRTRLPTGAESRGCDPSRLAAAFVDWNVDVQGLLASAVDVSLWALHDRASPRQWSNGRVVLLGDAAHPMVPYLSQGANQALEDAAVLADQLADALGPRRTIGVAEALSAYQQARAPRVLAVHRAARGRGVSFHLPDGPRQRSRDERLAADDLESLRWLYGAGPVPLPTAASAVPAAQRSPVELSPGLTTASRAR